jgi:hypothetical protein
MAVTPVTDWLVSLHVLPILDDASNVGTTNMDPVSCDGNNLSMSHLSL